MYKAYLHQLSELSVSSVNITKVDCEPKDIEFPGGLSKDRSLSDSVVFSQANSEMQVQYIIY